MNNLLTINNLAEQIKLLLSQARQNTAQLVNTQLLNTYWEIGRMIVEYEQGGSAKAVY